MLSAIYKNNWLALSELLDTIASPELKARIAYFLFYFDKKQKSKFGCIAIDSFLTSGDIISQVPLAEDSYGLCQVIEVADRYGCAVSISKSLGKATEDKLYESLQKCLKYLGSGLV